MGAAWDNQQERPSVALTTSAMVSTLEGSANVTKSIRLSSEAAARFWRKVDRTGECWQWLPPPKREGYGQFWVSVDVGMAYAHRVAFEATIGPIPDGLTIDHLCRNRRCVNPAHLEPVTRGENVRRGEAAEHNRIKTHCPQGHEYDIVTRNGRRACQRCSLSYTHVYRSKKRAERAAA
jgi:hypothetical protein